MSTFESLWIILHQKRRSRILRDYRGGGLQFEFGNVMLRFDPEGFKRFAEFVAELNPSDCRRGNCRCGMRDKIAIELHPTGVVMTLSGKEAKDLREAVRGAWSVLRLTLPEFRGPHSGN